MIVTSLIIATTFAFALRVAISSDAGPEPGKPLDKAPTERAVLYPYHFVNLMPAFWRFWDAAQGTEKATKLRLFQQLVVKPNKHLYAEVVGALDDQRVDN